MKTKKLQSNKIHFLKDASILFGSFVIQTAFAIIPGYLVLRILSVDEVGQMKLLMTLLGFTIISELGVGKAIKRIYPTHLARGEDEILDEIVGVGLLFLLLTGLLLCVVFGGYYIFGGDIRGALTPMLVVILCLRILIEKVYRLLGFCLTSEAKYKAISAVRILNSILSLLLIPGAYWFGLTGYFAAQLISMVAALLVTIKFAGRRFKLLPAWDRLRELLAVGVHFVFINAQAKLFLSLEVILGGFFLPLADVAFYAIAANALKSVGKLFNFFHDLMFQRIAKDKGLAEDGSDKAQYIAPYVGTNALIFYSLTFPVMAGVYFAGKVFLTLFLPNYVPALPVLQVLCVGYAFYRNTFITRTTLMIMGRMRVITCIILFVLVFNTAVDLVLMRSMGIVGLAVGSSISYVLYFACMHMTAYGAGLGKWKEGLMAFMHLLAIGFLGLLLMFRLDEWGMRFAPHEAGIVARGFMLSCIAAGQIIIYSLVTFAAFALAFREQKYLAYARNWFGVIYGIIRKRLRPGL